jgi:hypothetical protein
VVFGTPEAVPQGLAAGGWQRTTAVMERLHLRIRQHGAGGGRRVTTLCKPEGGLRQQPAFSHGYYNVCVPPSSLRQPLPRPTPTNGTGAAKHWQPHTPAMAAGLTARGWTLREGLMVRVPPWPQPQAV